MPPGLSRAFGRGLIHVNRAAGPASKTIQKKLKMIHNMNHQKEHPAATGIEAAAAPRRSR
jgi:hypothetical protein